MESVVLLLAIGFVGYIVYWSIRNDGVKSISEQRGFIKMKDEEEASSKSPPGAR